MGENDTRLWRFISRYVDEARILGLSRRYGPGLVEKACAESDREGRVFCQIFVGRWGR